MSKLQRGVEGFIAWCDEFVGHVKDNEDNGLTGDFREQLGFLRRLEPDDLHIPDVMNDEDAVKIIDELMYRLKRVDKTDDNPVATDLWHSLKSLINVHRLGGDPHTFASLPEQEPKRLLLLEDQTVRVWLTETMHYIPDEGGGVWLMVEEEDGTEVLLFSLAHQQHALAEAIGKRKGRHLYRITVKREMLTREVEGKGTQTFPIKKWHVKHINIGRRGK